MTEAETLGEKVLPDIEVEIGGLKYTVACNFGTLRAFEELSGLSAFVETMKAMSATQGVFLIAGAILYAWRKRQRVEPDFKFPMTKEQLVDFVDEHFLAAHVQQAMDIFRRSATIGEQKKRAKSPEATTSPESPSPG